MLPVTPYKAQKYPPSRLFPRFGDAGSLPPQYRRGGNEHLQAMIARRQASQKLMADRAPQQAEIPGEVFHDAMEEEPEAPVVPEDPDMPPLEEVPAQMPPRGPPPDDEAQMEPAEAPPVDYRRRQRQFQGAGQLVGMGAGGLLRGVGMGVYYGAPLMLGVAQGAFSMMGGPRANTPRSPSPQEPEYSPARAERDQPAPKRMAAHYRIHSPPPEPSPQYSRPRQGRSPDPDSSARAGGSSSSSAGFAGSHRGGGFPY